MISGLIFDFDGLILDTEMPVFQAWQEVYQSLGFNLSFEQWAVNIGAGVDLFDPYDDLEKKLGRSIDRQVVKAKRRKRQAVLIKAQPVLPGVRDYLSGARRLGLKVGLASSSSRSWVVGHLSRLGLDEYFDFMKCGDEVEKTKPDPELYMANLRALELEGQQAIALEDSPNGIAAAKAAGIFCVAVPNPLTSRLTMDGADLRLDSLAAMPLEELLRAPEMRGS